MLITEKHKEDIWGIISCYDRIIIKGTAGTFGYADGMTSFFYQQGYKIFDFGQIFTPITEQIKATAENIARANGLEIECIRKAGVFRKEDRIAEIISERGEHEGIVHIFSAVEIANTYKPWHDKGTGKTCFKNGQTKCLHYYFYFIDRELGCVFTKCPQ